MLYISVHDSCVDKEAAMGVGASKVYCAKSLRAALDARPDALAALQDLHARDATLHGATAAALAAQFAAGGERCVVGRSFPPPFFFWEWWCR